jgi:hypothetical protein
MSNASLDINIKANADQVLSAIKKVQGNLDVLKDKINSLPEGDKKLGALSRQFTRLSVTQKKLVDDFDKLSNVVPQANTKLEQVGNSSKSARTALTSLSLTVQDLPFGFLGIQNNLPGVIQGFGNLTATTNGKVLPALKEIGKSLLGPAGIFLAFSAVTSAITIAVQKYGSLGNAIDALFGKQNALSQEYAKVNKSYQDFIDNQGTVNEVIDKANTANSGQIIVIQALTKKATDLTLSQKEQKNALLQLQEISGDYYGGLKTGADNIKAIEEATKNYIQVLQAKTNIQQFANKVSDLDFQIEQQNRYNQSLKNSKDSLSAAATSNFKNAIAQQKLGYSTFYSVGALKESTTQFNQNEAALKKLNGDKKIYTDLIQKEIDGLNKVVKITEKETKAKKDSSKANADLFEERKKLVEFAVPMGGPFAGDEFESFRKRLQQQAEIYRERKKQEQNLGKLTYGFIDDFTENIKSATGPKIEDVIFNVDRMKAISAEYQRLVRQRFENIKNIIETTLAQPLNYIFDTIIEGGKISWKELGNIVIEQLKRIAIQIATTAAAVAIADLLTGGGYSASVKLFNKATNLVNQKESGLGVPLPGIANFGNIRGGGMGGQVVFVQRGSDLVGVLNRTNATINRVG